MKNQHLILLAAVAFASLQTQAGAQAVVDLGAAASFGVLGNTTVTNTGSTVVTGDLGVSPGTAYTGFPPGVLVNGAIHAKDAIASQAHADAVLAFNSLAGEVFTQDLTGQDLGARTLSSGVYRLTATALLTGILTLDAGNNPNARFDFQIGSTLTTAGSSQILLINGAQAGNVYWQVGSSATVGSASAFTGNVLANTSITMTTGASVNGRLVALGGAVTLDNNAITVPTAAIPEPATTALIAAFGALGLACWCRRNAGA